jgi:hypothetical protein
MVTCVTKRVRIDSLKPKVSQIARHGAEQIQFRAEDMEKNGQHQPIGITDDGRIIFGHGRYLSAKLLGWEEMDAKVYSGLTESQFIIIGAGENLHKQDITGYQKFELVNGLKQLNPTWKNVDVAKAFSVAEGWICQLLMVEKAIPPLFEAFKGGHISITDTYEIARHPVEEQHRLWTAKQNGASRETLRGAARQRKAGKTKSSNAKIPLKDGQLVVRRKNLDMDKLIASLEECLLFAKEDAASGFDIKTFERMMGDRAKGAKDE